MFRLTRRKAIDFFRELWQFLAETGKEKTDWPRWKYNSGDIPTMAWDCPLCEYANRWKDKNPSQRDCRCYKGKCLIDWPECICILSDNSLYKRWQGSGSIIERKKLAKMIFELPETKNI